MKKSFLMPLLLCCFLLNLGVTEAFQLSVGEVVAESDGLRLKVTPGCVYTINPTTLNVSSLATTFTFILETSAPACDWSISSSVPWITITGPATPSGTGTTAINISISANTSSAQRTGNVSITGYALSQLTITQQGINTCTVSLPVVSKDYDYNGYTAQPIAVLVSHPECTWTAVSTVSWITISSPSSGTSTGSGTVTYSVSANTTGSLRTGTLLIGGVVFTVTQGANPVCTVTANPTTTTNYTNTGGQGYITVTAGSGCQWTASSSVSTWLTLTPTSGTGNGIVVYTVSANTATSSRSAFITIGTNVLTITQEGVIPTVCTYTMTGPAMPLVYQASSNNIAFVNAVPNDTTLCTWKAVSSVPWITITSPTNGAGSGTNLLKFSVTQNLTGAERTGSILLLGTSTSLTVTQSSLSMDTSGLANALDNASLTWQSGGSLPFLVDTREYIYGASSAKSGPIGDGHSSWLQTVITGPGTLSFYWKVSSERGFDTLRFTIDGIRYGEISGNIDWQPMEIDIQEGSHILRWTYSKDSASSSGVDAGWVDKVNFKSSVSTSDPNSPQSLYRFFNTLTGVHFFTAVESEKLHVINTIPQFQFEGVAYKVYLSRQPDTSSVYRFYNNSTGVHFYTISDIERDNVIRNNPQFAYEGTAFYALTVMKGNARPVYRFFNTHKGWHFYTVDDNEKDYILRNLPQYLYEGIAYYAK